MHFLILFYTLVFQPAPLTIVSPDFPNDGNIPARFTCDGEGVNPTLIINGMPEGTKTLTLIVDNDGGPENTTQWVVWNIQPNETILENTIPGTEGINSAGKKNYQGLCPEQISQRYSFKVYALDSRLGVGSNAKSMEIEKAMEGHILAKGFLAGEYNRSMARTGKAK